ncbi:hypothetical protein [Candidatus Mesenet endosymbiont of Agriotes lineatus]|uniref:hypothetical protein n=1 Tax=Candidatus Mesenet endosymbiont of Agriotes lineatus TaxID=3077948 RepID=UPI0030D1F5B2
MNIAQNKRVLPKKEVIKLDDNLQIDLYYNNLNDKQLEAAKQEIKDLYQFENLDGMKNPDITNILTIFMHDNEKDFSEYGSSHTDSYNVGQTSEVGTHIAYVYHNQYGGDSLQTQVSYALFCYNNGLSENKILPDVVEPLSQHVLNQEKTNEIAKLISAKPSKEAIQSYEDDDEDYYGNEKDDDEGLGMQYEMKNGSLHITDGETNKVVKIPKKFKYLKLEEDGEGEYKLVLCDKKGHALSDSKKYAKIDDKCKYINIKAVNLDEDIEFDDYDEEDLFFIQPDGINSQVAKILDIYEDEIGMLFNNDFI